MSEPTPSIRLQPMSEAEFEECRQRSILRHAEESVRRGLWKEAHAREASERDFALLLPHGRATPGRHFAVVIDVDSGQRVGETWYTVSDAGGRCQLWIDWLWIDPEHRRKRYATATMARLEAEARVRGADRLGLSVWFDNPGAIALYTRLGYVPHMMRMMKVRSGDR